MQYLKIADLYCPECMARIEISSYSEKDKTVLLGHPPNRKCSQSGMEERVPIMEISVYEVDHAAD